MDEKRMIGDWEVLQSIHIGDREVFLLHDPKNTEAPYAVCYGNTVPGLGIFHSEEGIGSTDYLEMAELFVQRVQGQIAQVRADRERLGEPQEVFGKEHCLPGGMEQSLEGRIAVMRLPVLRHEYRNAARQLVYVVGGFGASANARGRTVFGYEVFSGEKSTWQRGDVLGVLDPAKAPDWVKPRVEAIRAQIKAKDGKDHER